MELFRDWYKKGRPQIVLRTSETGLQPQSMNTAIAMGFKWILDNCTDNQEAYDFWSNLRKEITVCKTPEGLIIKPKLIQFDAPPDDLLNRRAQFRGDFITWAMNQYKNQGDVWPRVHPLYELDESDYQFFENMAREYHKYHIISDIDRVDGRIRFIYSPIQSLYEQAKTQKPSPDSPGN